MEWLVHTAARLVRAAQTALTKKWSFFGVFCIVFFGSVALLARLDFLPQTPPAPAVTLSASPLVASSSPAAPAPAGAESPVSVSIPSISLSATVADPTTTDIEALDAFLLHGAVRYPTSALLNENGNVVLFGHSSYLPVVKNQAYKTFDGIQKLKAGDTIVVTSATTAYTYEVRTVAKEDANSAAIPLDVSGRVLTLSTCDSFTTKTDRFVVTADFVSSHSVTAS